MFPPQTNTSLDIEALSGICGSISIACWVVVFSPQIIENFRRSSADGLSIVFLTIWLAGDVFNILGAVLQGVLPTMIILAIYYTLADIVLITQVFYYRGFTLKDVVKKPQAQQRSNEDQERQPLLNPPTNENGHVLPNERRERRSSLSQGLRKHLSNTGAEHLSPATPLLDAARDPPAVAASRPTSLLQTILFNTFAILIVCLAGVFGWWLSTQRSRRNHRNDELLDPEPLEFDALGQVFGYFCAALYLGSRLPQLLLNYRRKSTEGVSLLFFLFACIGNLTYDMSIFAYNPENACQVPGDCQPGEASRMYARYIAVNASWIAGSAGTLFLDMAIFVQFFLYRKDDYEDPLRLQHGASSSSGPIVLVDDEEETST